MSSNGTDSGFSVNQLKLTDLIDDCLEHIFLYLDYDDLIRVAHTNKQLKPAADMAFMGKAGKKKFRLHVANSHRISNITEHTFEVFKLKTSLRLLRCFGHLMSKLHIDTFHAINPNPSRDLNLVLRYAKEFCAETLTKLSLHYISDGVFDSVITKPFAKVENVEILRCKLGVNMTNFNAWFPVMRRLELTSNHFVDCAAIAMHFPHLEHLGIVGGGMLQTKFIRDALRLNKQLTSFALDRAYSPEFFRYVSKLLPRLVDVKFRGYPKDFCTFRDNVINFKGVKKLEIGFIDGMEQQMVSNIKLSFDRLDEITLDLAKYNCDSGLFTFLKQHQSIVTLTLRSSIDSEETPNINEGLLTDIVQTLPLLSELNFFGVYFSIDDLCELLNNFNLLKYSFSVENSLLFDNLKIRLGNKWQATIDDGCVKVERNI